MHKPTDLELQEAAEFFEELKKIAADSKVILWTTTQATSARHGRPKREPDFIVFDTL